jgi:hypothetical protein
LEKGAPVGFFAKLLSDEDLNDPQDKLRATAIGSVSIPAKNSALCSSMLRRAGARAVMIEELSYIRGWPTPLRYNHVGPVFRR